MIDDNGFLIVFGFKLNGDEYYELFSKDYFKKKIKNF